MTVVSVVEASSVLRAEAAMVNLNRRTFGEAQAREVAQRLGLPEEAWRSIPAPLAASAHEDPHLLADLVVGEIGQEREAALGHAHIGSP